MKIVEVDAQPIRGNEARFGSRRPAWVAALAIAFILSFVRSVAAQCPQPNGNDTEPDNAAIQCLLDQGGTIILDADVQNGYLIANPGLVLSNNGTTLTGSSAFGYRALLRATADLNVPMLQVAAGGVSNYTISNVWFYGDRFNRTSANCTGDQSVNLWLRGSGWLVDNVESDTAPCNTGTLVDNSNSDFEIRNSWFANNGWSETEVGNPCPARASTYAGNSISSGNNRLGFGLVVGFHPWDVSFDLTDAGSVINNVSSGAVDNLTVEGIGPGAAGMVSGNTVSGAQGTNGFGTCTISKDYTVYLPHAGAATLQPDWFEMQFDNGACAPR